MKINLICDAGENCSNIGIAKALIECDLDNDDLVEIAKHLLVFTDERKGR